MALHKTVKGFTLMEISMVLVIIGLITGSIFVGQSLVRQSQITSVAADVQRYTNAALAFQQKYGELPGDLSTATNYWGAAGGSAGTNYTTDCYGTTAVATNPLTCNGNGDGQIIGTNSTYDAEAFLFWQHLANAGLIQGSYTGVAGSAGPVDHVIAGNCPASKLEGAGFGISHNAIKQGSSYWYDGVYNHTFFIGSYMSNNVPINPVLTAAEAQAIDTKYDDGYPSTGNIRPLKPADSAALYCATSTTMPSYNITDTIHTGQQCGLVFISGF